jgi:hypothetical protein
LTKRKEKKNESDAAHRKLTADVAVMFRRVYEEDAEVGDREVDILLKSIERLEAEAKKETDKQRRILIRTHQRFLVLQAAIRHDQVTMKMAFALLASVVAGVDFDVEAKKKEFDNHLAKRLGQLFGDSGNEAIYG